MKSFIALLTRHPLSLAGTSLATVCAILVAVFLGLDLLGFHGNPYIGLVSYLLVPALFVVGLLLIPIGLHRARTQTRPDRAFPVLDLNQASVRNRLLIFFALTAVNLVIVGVASFKTVEVMDTKEFCGQACHSVMAPEYASFQRGAHARVACVDCHIGSGAGWFVKSKLSGSWQLVSVALDLYPQPIPTPVHNLRPARDTCEECHWPQKFVGDRLKVITRYQEDDENTETKTVLLLRIGGISGRESQGIHWHVDPANAIRYRSDESREEIYEVELARPDGSVERWLAPGAEASPAGGEWRAMDCVDCHNRPSHTFRLPEAEIDLAIERGKVARDLPAVRRVGLELLEAEYGDADAARAGIADGLRAFYRDSHPDVLAARSGDIDAAAEALWEAWSSNVFPQMSVGWGTYPNHIGHEQTPGCFRCHDDLHESAEGGTISQDCDTCHSLLAMEEVEPEILSTLSP